MKAGCCTKEGTSCLDVYRSKVEQIEFMRQYLEEPEIFNFGSTKFKEFLINSFSNLHKDFHYLPFLNKENIDQELVKVSEILQIMPNNFSKKKSKFFEDWNDNSEINNFWMKFFSLFHIKQVNEHFSAENSFAFESKINFLKEINCTLHYLNYDFPVINLKKTMQINLDEEIKSWNDVIHVKTESTVNESTISDCERKLLFNVNTEKLITDLNHVFITDNKLKEVKQECKPDVLKSLTILINLIKEVLTYKENLNLIDYKILSKDAKRYLKINNENEFSNNLFFLQRYSNLIKLLKSKMKLLY